MIELIIDDAGYESRYSFGSAQAAIDMAQALLDLSPQSRLVYTVVKQLRLTKGQDNDDQQ